MSTKFFKKNKLVFKKNPQTEIQNKIKDASNMSLYLNGIHVL
jgi:hypothetical protein